MSSDDAEAAKPPIEPRPKAPPITFTVVAAWLLAVALGVAFWILLFHATPVIVRQVQRL
jgi:hypothetical protein